MLLGHIGFLHHASPHGLAVVGYRRIGVDLATGVLAGNEHYGDALYQEFQQAWPRRVCRKI